LKENMEAEIELDELIIDDIAEKIDAGEIIG